MDIAAYCRVSTDKEEQLDSLNHQKEFFLTYARKNGYHLYKVYADEGISGISLKRRDAFRQLMSDAALGAFQMVVVKDISRFARNTVDALQSIRTLKGLGVRTLFLTANMDSMGDSEFVLTLFSAMAQEESCNLSKRVKWGKRINAEKGRVPRVIYGYDRVDNFTLAVNPKEAAVIQRIFSLYLQGVGCRRISTILNDSGERTKFAECWNPRSVGRILDNPIYSGILVNHKYEIADFLTGKQVALPEQAHFRHLRPQWAIVSMEQFQKAQAQRRQRRAARDDPAQIQRHSGRYLFSNLIRCAHCGRAFCRKTYTYANTRVYWHCVTNDHQGAAGCDNRVSLEEADLKQALAQYFSQAIGDLDAFSQAVSARLSAAAPPQVPSWQHAPQRRQQLQEKIARYQELYANGLMELDTLKEKQALVQSQLAQAEPFPPPPAISAPAAALAEVKAFLQLETTANTELRQILEKIQVSRDGSVEIILRRLSPA